MPTPEAIAAAKELHSENWHGMTYDRMIEVTAAAIDRHITVNTKMEADLNYARRLLEMNAKIEAQFVDGSPEKAVAEICRLRDLLQQMLDVAENADETGYVTDVGFVDLDKLHGEVRDALTPRITALSKPEVDQLNRELNP